MKHLNLEQAGQRSRFDVRVFLFFFSNVHFFKLNVHFFLKKKSCTLPMIVSAILSTVPLGLRSTHISRLSKVCRGSFTTRRPPTPALQHIAFDQSTKPHFSLLFYLSDMYFRIYILLRLPRTLSGISPGSKRINHDQKREEGERDGTRCANKTIH